MFTFHVHVSGPDNTELIRTLIERIEQMHINIDDLIKKVEESNTLQDSIITSNREIAALIRKHITNHEKLHELANALESQAPETAEAVKANLDLKAELEALEPVEPEPGPNPFPPNPEPTE